MNDNPMNLAQAAGVVSRHLIEHGLPEPASLHLTTDLTGHPELRVHTSAVGLRGTAAALLAWADTLTTVSLRAWRPPAGDWVHLDLNATLTSPHGAVSVMVFGGVAFDPALFGGLEPRQSTPLTLGQLIAWADGGRTAVAA
jgi:hypothetical protein